jgi:hypothetical protein
MLKPLPQRPEKFVLINHHTASGGGDKLAYQALACPGAIVHHAQPMAIAQVAGAAPFVLGKFDVTDACAALDPDARSSNTVNSVLDALKALVELPTDTFPGNGRAAATLEFGRLVYQFGPSAKDRIGDAAERRQASVELSGNVLWAPALLLQRARAGACWCGAR